jgi:hypothetical protein
MRRVLSPVPEHTRKVTDGITFKGHGCTWPLPSLSVPQLRYTSLSSPRIPIMTLAAFCYQNHFRVRFAVRQDRTARYRALSSIHTIWSGRAVKLC